MQIEILFLWWELVEVNCGCEVGCHYYYYSRRFYYVLYLYC